MEEDYLTLDSDGFSGKKYNPEITYQPLYPGVVQYSSKDEAKDIEGSKVLANADAIREAEAQGATALDQDFNKRRLRSGVNRKLQIGNQLFSTEKATQLADPHNKKVTKLDLKEIKTHKPDEPGLHLTSAEKRNFQGTGMIRGTFSEGTVLRWVKKLNLPKNQARWPIDKLTGKPKSLAGFIKAMNAGWKAAGRDAFFRMNEDGGIEAHRGHAFPSNPESGIYTEGGSDWHTNISPQGAGGAYVDEETGKVIGSRGQTANIAQSDTLLKHPDDLKAAGIEGETVKHAFAAYLLEDEPNLESFAKYGKDAPEIKSKIAHEVGISAEGAKSREDLRYRRKIHKQELDAANPTNPNKLLAEFRPVKEPRSLLRKVVGAAGQSWNPFINIAGDVVGAAMDGVVVMKNPQDADAMADFALSGSQALLSVGAGILAVVPVPGARVGSLALIRVGDNIGKVERLWNMTREGRQLARSPSVKEFKARTGQGPEIVGTPTADNRMYAEAGKHLEDMKIDARSRVKYR